MLAQLPQHLVLLGLSLASCAPTDDGLVTSALEPGSGPLIPVESASEATLLPVSVTLLRAIRRFHHSTPRQPLQRQLRHDVIFWAARGKRPDSVHYWDIGVPPAGMTSATMRRFLGLPSKRQLEWEARIDNGNGHSGSDDDDDDDDKEREAEAEAVDDDADQDEEELSAVGDSYPSERNKKEFWASRGKKGGGGDFWASRGKKDGGADFWASRGRRGDLAGPFKVNRDYSLPPLKSDRGRFWGALRSRGKWTK